MIRSLTAAAVVTTLALGASVPVGEPPAVTGIYSDMHISPTTGDLGGLEIFLLSSNRGDWVLVQMAEGAASAPVLAAAAVRDSLVTFTLPASSALGGLGTFSGVVRGGRLHGAFQNGFEVDL